jgi:hypothetical protein
MGPLGWVITITVAVLILRALVKATPDATAHHIEGQEEYNVEIVGESKYQKVLGKIAGGRQEDGVEHETTARLIPENNNSYDKNAVRIDIENKTVGYLSRDNAKIYRKQLKKAGHANSTATCAAIIVGGWDRGRNDRGHFGVRLDLPYEELH